MIGRLSSLDPSEVRINTPKVREVSGLGERSLTSRFLVAELQRLWENGFKLEELALIGSLV